MTNIEVSMLTKIDSKPMSHSFTKKNNLRRLVSPQIHSAKLFFFDQPSFAAAGLGEQNESGQVSLFFWYWYWRSVLLLRNQKCWFILTHAFAVYF